MKTIIGLRKLLALYWIVPKVAKNYFPGFEEFFKNADRAAGLPNHAILTRDLFLFFLCLVSVIFIDEYLIKKDKITLQTLVFKTARRFAVATVYNW